MEENFINACIYSNIENAKRLYNLGVNIHANDDKAFKMTCLAGCKIAAENMYNSYEMSSDTKADRDNYIERYRCKYLETVKWLLKISIFDDKLINKNVYFYNAELIKLIFDKGYKPLNNKMKKYYKKYIKRKQEIKENVVKYMVPELVDLVYDYE